MRRFIFVTALLALLVAPFARAEARTLNDNEIEAIRQGCISAQSLLIQQQRSDVGLRINRGREYEQLVRLMASFNSRVVLNKQSIPAFAQVTTDFQNNFITYKNDDVSYSNSLTTLLKMKCQEQPVTFYDTLTDVRAARATLASDVTKLDDLLNQYQTALTALKTDVTAKEKTGV